MTIRPPVHPDQGRCADTTPACGEQHLVPTSPAEHVASLLTSWSGTARLVLVVVIGAGALIGVMRFAPVRIDVAGLVQITPVDHAR